MNGVIGTLVTAAALAIAGVTSGITESILAAWDLRSPEKVKKLREPAADPSVAASACPTPGEFRLHPNRDATVARAFSSANYGRDAALVVESQALRSLSAGDRRTLVGFDLRTIDPFCTIGDATLRLYATSAIEGRPIEVYRLAGSWAEDSVSWDNQPETTGSPAGTSSTAGWQTWDVSEQVEALAEGNGDGLVVRERDEGEVTSHLQTYQSREGSQPPELVFTLR